MSGRKLKNAKMTSVRCVVTEMPISVGFYANYTTSFLDTLYVSLSTSLLATLMYLKTFCESIKSRKTGNLLLKIKIGKLYTTLKKETDAE